MKLFRDVIHVVIEVNSLTEVTELVGAEARQFPSLQFYTFLHRKKRSFQAILIA
ncbi:hypothetical protein [Anaerobacillus alkalilacustris]|uniref:hypothetical protein n=1 Tax=Anaerobacillus alkalilacustris TaxID=393763 RepID=UPI0014719B65|nr:hypothetical protein [Anaerobacillus alkalilacustris]